MSLSPLLMLVNCSSELNWASCAVNPVLSMGLSGFCAFSWAVNSFRNSSLPTMFLPVPACGK